ncbi:hypothetical protein GOODEAATRI_001039, partial [Goodea atripinnis]
VYLSLQIPIGLSNYTTHLFLNNNRLSSLPAFCFSDLFLLDELDLSHNQVLTLPVPPSCRNPVKKQFHSPPVPCHSSPLLNLDVSLAWHRLSSTWTSHPIASPLWTQRFLMAVPQLNVDISSLEKVICQTSDLPNLGTLTPHGSSSLKPQEMIPVVTLCVSGAVGLPLVLLMQDWDLCQSVRRTTDFLTLITMFLWFVMLMSYLIYYIRHNQVVARRHLEYLKFLESRDPFRPDKDLL